MLGTSCAKQAHDLTGSVHQVSLPVIFIHRTGASQNDNSCSQCVAEFRTHMERFWVGDLAPAEIGEGSKG